MSSENNSTPVTTKWYAISWMMIGLLHIIQKFWPVPLSEDMYLAIVFIMMIMTAIYYHSLTSSTHSQTDIISNTHVAALMSGAIALLTLFLWIHHTSLAAHMYVTIGFGILVFSISFAYLINQIHSKKAH